MAGGAQHPALAMGRLRGSGYADARSPQLLSDNGQSQGEERGENHDDAIGHFPARPDFLHAHEKGEMCDG
jgi:hypothetical protein